jgi:hypothetical protein
MGIGSAAEWFDRRNQLYRQLEEHGLPTLISGTAQLGWARALASWVDSERQPAEFGKPGTYCRPEFITTQQIQEYFASAEARFRGPPIEPPTTVGEVIALILRQRLEVLRQASNKNKRGGPAPVLLDGHMPESVIKAAAADLLDDCRFHGYPPGPHLTGLIQDLLSLDQVSIGAKREFDAREKAIWILAHSDDIRDRELARRVGVAHTTVREWRKDEEFQRRVAAVRLMIAEVLLAHTLRTDQKS